MIVRLIALGFVSLTPTYARLSGERTRENAAHGAASLFSSACGQSIIALQGFHDFEDKLVQMNASSPFYSQGIST
jgi:hypothetical protein